MEKKIRQERAKVEWREDEEYRERRKDVEEGKKGKQGGIRMAIFIGTVVGVGFGQVMV